MDGSRVTKDRAKALRRTMSLPEVLLWKAIKGGAIDRLRFRKQHPVGPYVLGDVDAAVRTIWGYLQHAD
jgi:very-short-patch-repair endonuclease